MENYFDIELKNLEREITNYKTVGSKSASTVNITTQSIAIDFSLSLNAASSPPGAAAIKFYEIKTSDDAIIVATLNKYYDNINEAWRILPTVTARYFDMSQVILPSGNQGVKIIAYGTNYGANNDAEKLQRGETVIMSCNLTIQSTHNFTIGEY